MIRQRVRNPNGQLGAIEYTILVKRLLFLFKKEKLKKEY